MNNNSAQSLAHQCANYVMENDAASKHLGIELIKISSTQVTTSMVVKDFMLNGHKSCHGGQIFSLADSTFAFACNAQNQAAVAASCHIDFLLPAFQGDTLIAVASQAHQGKRTGIYQVSITNQKDQLIALFKGNSTRIRRSVLPE